MVYDYSVDPTFSILFKIFILLSFILEDNICPNTMLIKLKIVAFHELDKLDMQQFYLFYLISI